MDKNENGDVIDKIESFFINLVKGNYSLPMTYWVYGMLGGVVWAVAIISVTQVLTTQVDSDNLQTITTFLYFLMLSYYVAVYVGIWTSSDKYQGNKVWSIMAKFVVIVTAIPIVTNLLKLM